MGRTTWHVGRLVGAGLFISMCLVGSAHGVEPIDKSTIILETNVLPAVNSGDTTDPYKLIDGIQYSGGYSLWTRGSAGYLLFDLQAISFLTHMNVQYSSTANDSLELLVSTNNVTYQSLGKVHFPSWNGQPSVNRPIGDFARWVKFVWGPLPIGYSYTMYEEVTFFGADGLVPVESRSFSAVKALYRGRSGS